MTDTAALLNGQAGIDVANQVFANVAGPDRFANGVALIETAAADGSVSPVRALLAFTDRLNQLDGNASHFTAIGVEIAGLVASGDLEAAVAVVDFLPAVNALQIGRGEAASVLIAMANSGALDVQLVAGCYLGQLITRGSFEGGEGGAWPGGNLSMTTAVQAIHNAVVGGSLGETQAYGLMAGLMVSPFPAPAFQPMNEMRALIGGDAGALNDVIDIFIASVGIIPFNVVSSAAGNIMSLVTPVSTPNLSLSELATRVHTAVVEGTLTGEQAVAMVVRFAPSYNADAIAAANGVAAEVIALVDDGFISQADALDMLRGTSEAARYLVAVAVADPDALPAAALRFATLVDTTTPTFMISGNMMTAQQTVTAINVGISLGGLSGASAVVMLTAMAFVPGGEVSSRNAMNAAADGVRGLLAGTIGGSDAAAAVVAALGPLGFTAEQGVTFLVALGASGFQQIFGSSVIWVNNADLAAAASAAIANLFHDHDLSAEAIGDALSAAFPLGVDSGELAVSTFIKAAPALAALEPDAYTIIGAALAQADAVSAGLAMGQVNDRVRGLEIDAEAGIAIVAGFAGAGTVEDQVAAGRELNAIVFWTGLEAAGAIAEIDAAVVAGALTRGEAIVLLAGAATDSSPQGLANLLAQIATYVDADAAAGVGALGAAVTAGALTGTQGLFVLVQVAALGSADTASAATATLLSWVDDGAITASDAATQLLSLADGAMALRAVAGANIAAMVTHGALDVATAIALVEAAVPVTLDADIAIVVLAHMSAAGDAALQSAVLDEINALIAGGDITLTNAIATLQALLPGASTALQAMVDEALAILLTDPATLAETAGLGSPAQVQAAVNAIVLLFTTDPMAAQGILDALAGRIDSGDLSSDRAATLLAMIYGRGGDAADAAFDAIVALTTSLDIPASTMANALATQVAAGALGATTAFVVFGVLSPHGSPVNAAVAGLISGGSITVAALDAAVDAGQYSASNAIAVLGSVVPGAAPGLRAEALTEVQGLVSETPALASQALPIFMGLAVSGDHALRLVGREGIEALAAVAPGVGSAAFLQLLSYMPVPDAAFLADTQAALNGLLAGGYLTVAEALQHIDDQLSPGNPSPLINAFQAVNILVALSAVDGARTAIYDYIRQEVAANSAAHAAGPSHPLWPFTAQPVIAALARGTIADLDHVGQTALVIVNISAILSTSQIVTSVAQGSIALIAVVAGFINRTGAMTEFGSYLAGRIAGLPLSEQIDSLDVISSLVGGTVDDLQPADATELLLGIYAGGAEAAALAELLDMGAVVCSFIVGAMTSGSTTLANGVEVMAALATSGVPAFHNAVATFLGDLLVGGQFTPAAVMSALEAAVADEVLTAQEMVALLQDVLVARLDPTNLPASAALQSAILAEIDALIAAHHVTFAEAVATMAASASGLSGAMLFAIGGEIVAFVGGHAGSEADSVDAILAASTSVITGAEALGLLVGIGIWGGAELQVAAGGGIAGLVAAGSVTSNGAAIGIYNAFLSSGLALSHLVAVTAGLWANGGIGVGAEVLYQVGSHGLATYADLAGQLATAVGAGTLSAGEMIDGAVAVVLRSGSTAAGADFVSALISQGVMAADDAVAELAASISPSGLSASQAAAVIAHLVADLPAEAHLLGVGVAEIAAAGHLALSEVTEALADLLADGSAGLDFSDAVTLLVGAATVAEVAAQAGAGLIALIGSDAQHLADALDVIGAAAGDGTLTPAGAVALMVGIAAAGTQTQQATVGAALDNLVQAGTVDLGTVTGRLTTEVAAGSMAGADAVFVAMQLPHDAASTGQVVSFINYLLGQEALSASDATGAIVAARLEATPPVTEGTAVDVLVQLALSHVQTPVNAGHSAAIIVQAGAALVTLVAGDEGSVTLLIDRLAQQPYPVVPLLAAIEAAAGPQSFMGQGAHAALLTYVTGAFTYEVVQYVGQLIGPQGLTATQSLPILVDIAIHGGVQGQVAVGQVLAHAVAAGSATMADVHDALLVPGLALEQGTMILAGMIDLSGGTIPMAVLSEIMASFHLPAGADGYRPYVQPVIAALSDAVHNGGPVSQAQGLSLGQAVLALSVYARFDDPGVRQDVGAAIAALIEEFTSSPDATIALLGRALVADTQGYGVLAAGQIAEVGAALGLTPAQLVHVVLNGTTHGLTASDAVAVLAQLTAYDSASYGGVSATVIAGLTDDHLSAAQAMDMFLGLAHISADQMVPILAGVAAAGTAADQIAVGRAIANLPTFDLSLLSQIPDAAVENVAVGIASSGSPSAPVILGPLFLIAGAALDAATMVLALEGGVATGALSAADGLRALVNLTIEVSRRMGDDALALRTDLHEALVAIVQGHLGADVAMGLLLTSVPATGWDADKMRAEVGGMFAALADAGLASATTITAALAAALGAGTLTGAAAAAFITGAAINREYTNPFPDSRDFAAALGDALGELIEAGSVAVGDAMAGVLATQTWFRMGWYPSEVTLLAAVAGHDAPGLQTAVGHALAALFQSGQLDVATGMPTFDAMVGAPDGLTAQQAMAVLFGMADGGAIGAYTIATEFAALCGRGALTAQEVADGVTAGITAGHFSPSYGIALLTYLASNDGAFIGLAVGEIVELMAGTGLTIEQVFDGLLAAPRDVGRAVPDAAVDSVVIGIIGALEELGVASHAQAVTGVMTAASHGRVSATNAAGVLLGLAGTADEAGMALVGNAFGELIAGGLDPTDVNTILFRSLQSNLVEAVPASSVIAYAMGAITGLPNADDYLYAFGSILAQAAPEAAVGAVDRAYEAGAIDAHDVVGLLTWMHGVSGALTADTRWVIGQELWKMHEDGGVALAEIFTRIVATVTESTSWMRGALIGVMSATLPAGDVQQIAFGHTLGELIVGGGMTIGTALFGLSQAGLSDGQLTMLILSVAGGGGSAEELGVGQYFGLRLAATLAPNADLDMVALFDHAVAVDALTVPELVGVLIGVGMVQSSSAAAVRTSVYALDALVTSGRITVEDTMALVDGMVPALGPAQLVHWLANLSVSPVLHDAVATEIVALVADGVLGASQALGYIAEVTNTWISGDTAADLVVSIAGHGDAALQDAVGTYLAVVLHGSHLSEIAAAVTDGSLSPEGAVHVIANLVAALASDPSATVRNWAVSQLDHYVDDGLVDAQTVSSVLMDATAHATTTGLISLGAIMGTLGGGLAAIHDAIADGSLSAEQGMDLLLSIGAVRDIGDPVFQAARDEIVGLVQDGALTGTQVLAVTRAAGAAGWLSESHVEVIAFSIFGDGSAADDAAVGVYAATRVDHLGDRFGVGDDTYFTGILAETGVTFLRVQNGQMTAAAAIAHIKEYAAEHDVSAYAGIFALEGLFQRYQNGAARTLTHDTRVDMIALGDLAAELAGRVAEGTTSAYVRSAQGGTQFEAADPNALTRAEALQVLNWEAGLAFTQEQAALARYMFANDLWVAQQVRLDSSPTSPISMTNVVNGMLPGNPFFNTSVPDVGRSGYAYDLALVSLLEQVTAADRVPDQQDYRIALEALSTRLTKGIAQDALISQYVAGNLTFAQVLEALDTEVAATGLGSTPAHQQLMHSMSMAWLQLRAREYVAEHPGTGGAIEAADFMQQLSDPQYGDELLTGYGALLAMSSSGAGALISSLDKQAAYQEAFDLIVSRTPSTIPLSDRDQAVLDVLIPMSNGMQWVLEKFPLGRAFITVGEDPGDAAAYARLGGQVATVFANKLAVDALFAGTPWGAAITATKFGAQVGLFVLSMGAVQDALGEGPTLYLRGQLTMAGATAALLGDTISDLGAAGAEIAIQSAPHFVEFSDAVNRGDAAGIASSIGEIAMDYYKLQTGVDLRLYGPIGERFGDLIVHLFTGDTGELGNDVRALGSAYLDTIIQNPYLAAIGERMVQYAGTINGALSDINDSYRILGQNALTGLLLVGTRLDDAGNAIRDVAHKVGGFFTDILRGLGIDGYISGATVFADANFNGVLDAGELSTTTDANGRYTIAANGAPLVLQGGFDIATNMAFTGTMQAPAGSTAVTPLTTLIQQVAASTNGDPVAAQQLVASALGLNPSLDLNDFDPITATRTGVAGAADAFATASSVLNTVSLLQAAGATDAYEALAARIVAARTLDLTDAATVMAIAASAGVSAGIVGTVAQLATASNALAEQAVAAGGDPMRFMRYVTAVSIAAQGDTAHDLAAAGSNAAHLASVLAQHTGANLANQVAGNRTQVGGFGDHGGGGGEVPLQISADGLGIELALNGSSAVAGNWVRLAAQDSGLHAGSTVLVYSVDAAGNYQAGTDLSLSTMPAVGVGGVEDDHGARLLLGAQSVYLAAGDQLRFAVLDGNQTVNAAPSMQLAARGDGSLQATIGGLHLTAVTNNSMTAATTLAEAQRDTGDAFVFLRQGETLNVELAGSSANANTLAFVRVDIDAATGARSVAGVAYGNTAAFTEAVRSHMDGGFHQTHGGDFAATANWTVAGATGYYAPVLVTPNGQIFVVGTANADGHEHIRAYGENTFGFEDLASHQGSDFDYNDMVMRLHSTRGDFS